MVRIVLGGCTGRMGREIVAAAEERNDIQIVGGVARSASVGGEDLGFSVSASPADFVGVMDVFLDFSTADAMEQHLEWCLEAGRPYVGGITGLDEEHRELLEDASERIPVFYAANFSVGVAVVTELVRQAAEWMPEADVEMIELHHRRKRDAPSGTAIVLVEAVEDGRSDDESNRVFGRTGTAVRQSGEIGIHSLRGGGNPGEHQVLFASEGEEVWIGHRALNRSTFAQGALWAASWIPGQPPGMYGMADLIAGDSY